MKKSKCPLLLKLFALSGLLMLVTSSARAWRFSLPASSRAESVVVDGAGNIIAAGRAYYGGEVIKLSGTTGQLIWQFNASHNQTEQEVGSIALDSHGDVFVLIGTYRGVTKISGVTGQMIWQGNIGGSTAGCQSRFNAIAVDREDNVVAAGTAGCLFNVAKLDGATGVEKWHYEREGYGKAVAVDPFGNVAAAGLMNRNFGTVKLRGDNGAELWQRELNGNGNFTDVFEEANAVAMDQDGSVVVAGVTSNAIANFRDFTVARYLPDGTNQWTQIIDGQFWLQPDRGGLINQSNDIANAVAIDKDGGVIAAGSIQEDIDIPASKNPQAPEHFDVVKISRNGTILWRKPAEDPAFEQEHIPGHAFALSVNSAGNIVAAGVHNGRFTLVKFWGRTGGRAWRRQISSGTAGNGNEAIRVVMDAASDVIAVGETTEASGFSQFTVVKLRRIDGLDYSADPTPPAAPETVVKYAPLVYLHSDDKYRPDNPIKFINNSSLRWFREGGCEPDPIADLHAVEPQRLGSPNEVSVAAYSDNPGVPTINGSDCRHLPQPTFTTRDFTRPYDDGRSSYNAFWNNAYYEREGFYIDLDDGDQQDELRGGIWSGPSIFPGAPVFFEYVPGRYVTYWFFYPYDDFSFPHPLLGDISIQHHEGDWERISIQLDMTDSPVNVFYYSHGGGEIVSWQTVDKYEGTHPVVYSAKGSHASYPGEGLEQTQCYRGLCAHDSTVRGPRWLTWIDLQNVTIQPWYGFGGAWGQVDAFHTPVGSIEGTNFTGPLGPSTFKNSLDKWSPRITGRVTGVDSNGLAGVRIRAFDTQGNVEEEVTTCEGNPECGGVGNYSFRNLVFGKSYTLVPSKTGYAFTPAVLVFQDLRKNETANFAVGDTIPPRLNLPSDITANAYVPQGATVSFTVTATDNVTQNPRIACTSSSGSLFRIGNTTVACTATDDAGNSANGTFRIVVKGAGDQITDLVVLVKGFNLQKGIENSLVVKLENALARFNAGNRTAACNHLSAFINEVQAQSGKKMSVTQANQMLAAANRIRAVIGCL